MRRRPGYLILSVGVLALGIGANVAIFTLAHRLFLQPPAQVEAPERLVRVFRSWAPGMGASLSYPDYEEYREGATGLTGLALLRKRRNAGAQDEHASQPEESNRNIVG